MDDEEKVRIISEFEQLRLAGAASDLAVALVLAGRLEELKKLIEEFMEEQKDFDESEMAGRSAAYGLWKARLEARKQKTKPRK